MTLIIVFLVIYCFFQIKYYIKYGYIREIFIFIVIMAFSSMFLFDYVLELKLPKPLDWITFLLDPVATRIFGTD